MPLATLPNALPSGGAPNLRVEKAGGFDSLVRGAGALGQAGDVIQAGIEREQHEAAVVSARDELTAYQRDTTDTMHGVSTPTSQQAGDAAFSGREARAGFMTLRGKAAAEASADTLEELEAKRQKRAAAITNEKARELFLRSSAESYEGTRRSIESHVGAEIERAKVDSIAAAADEAVRAAALDPGNDRLAEERIASVVGPIAALGRGQEFADTETLKVQQRVAATRLDALLSAGDVESASRVLEANKWALGSQLDNYHKAVEKGREVAGIEQYVAAVVHGSRLTNGEVDEAAALAKLDKMEPERRAKAEPIMNQHLVRERRAWDAETTRVGRESYTLVNRDGWAKFAASPLSEQLNQRDPRLWDQLRNADQRDLDRLERKSRIRLNDAQARREQAQIDRIGLNEWETLLTRDPTAADLERFKATHRDMSPGALSELDPMKAKADKVQDLGLRTRQTEFQSRALQEAEGYLPPVVGNDKQKGQARAARAAFEAKAGRRYADEALKLKRDLTDAEAAGVITELVHGKEPLVPKTPEAIDREAERLIRQAMPGSGSGKSVKSYLVSPDKKRRVPVYTDGTRGPEEQVP